MRLKLNKNKIIILSIISLVLLGFTIYYYPKYQEEIKTYGLYVIIAIMVFMFLLAMNEPRRKRTPEEQRAYNEERAKLQAQLDHQKEERVREENKKEFDRWQDIFFGSPKRKRRN